MVPLRMLYVGVAGYSYLTSSFSSFFLLSIALTAVIIFYTAYLYPEFLTPVKHIPTPPNRSWITGNATAYDDPVSFERMIKWTQSIPHDGLIRYYEPGNMERILVASPKALRELLVHNTYEFPKPALMRTGLQRFVGKSGLILLEGEEHKKHRKNLKTAFSYRTIKDLYPTFWAKSVEMVKCIEKDLQTRTSADDNVVVVEKWASRATLDIIGLAGMNQDFESLSDPTNKLPAQYHRALGESPIWLNVIFTIAIVLGFVPLVFALPIKFNKDVAEGTGYVRQVAQRLINDEREKIKKNPDQAEHGKDVLSVALNSGEFTDQELVDQVMTFLAAGHDTTSAALQWSVYALCKHPSIQERLRAEIRANIPPISLDSDNPAPITAAQLDSLPYLSAVCNEVLRFHSPAFLTYRATTHPLTLSGTPLPAQTQISICPEVINRHPDLWGPDANEFNPERWLKPGQANTGGANSNYALMTFLHGPRSCIAQGFARAELACLVVAVVGRFRVELKDPEREVELKRAVTVTPADGLLVRFEALEGW